MKRYYIKYPRNFANEYSLYSADVGSKEEQKLISLGFERITRKRAQELCRIEKWRRKTDYNFSGYAPTEIIPFFDISEGL